MTPRESAGSHGNAWQKTFLVSYLASRPERARQKGPAYTVNLAVHEAIEQRQTALETKRLQRLSRKKRSHKGRSAIAGALSFESSASDRRAPPSSTRRACERSLGARARQRLSPAASFRALNPEEARDADVSRYELVFGPGDDSGSRPSPSRTPVPKASRRRRSRLTDGRP